MTTARPTPRMIGIIDRALAILAWTCQAGAAALYLAVTFQSDAWRKMLAHDPVYTISVWGCAVGLALVWMTGLREEQVHYYNRRVRIYQRKVRTYGHGGLLFIAASSAADQKDRIGMWAVMGMAVLISSGTWAAWMQTRTLPAEDQAVIDAIHDREAQQASEAYDTSEKERRRERLSAIVAGLGYELTDTPDQPAPDDEPPAHRWQIPARKHSPLVYFIRNGNRVKIGTSTEVKRRIRTLALRAENVVLLLDGGQPLERDLHKQFADLRIGNTEWFAYEGALVDYVHAQTARLTREDQQK
ncbi:GIY-YIG nuclease family protein [Streptomyces kaempferi]|uniref:GIY-YIG nuclease family protein n=1 Tax=Streptomyces kaempferi TaxID=333725 RepID=A0ABW3XKK1_9ACTN